MRLARLRDLLDRLAAMESGFTCKHGHLDCALSEGGMCLDEAWSQQCDDESCAGYDQRMEENDFLEEDE